MKNPTTQKEEVLKHLEEFGSITSMDAINMYGITRLADKIHLLRKAGHGINTKSFKFTNRYGNCSTYGVYELTKS